MGDSNSFPLYLIPLLPLLGAAFNLLLGRKVPRWAVHIVACASVLAALVVSMVAVFYHLYPEWSALAHSVPHGTLAPTPQLHSEFFDWIVTGEVSVKFGLLLDPLSAVMIMVVTFVGFLIHVYSTGYMAHEPDYARFFAYLNLFTGAMLILVLGDNLAVLFVGWEGVGACSYMLIGFWYDKTGTTEFGDVNASAGKKAFIVNRVGDLAFVIGMFILFAATGTLNFDGLAKDIPALTALWTPLNLTVCSVAGAAALFLFIGATGKSAQIPLYIWLPDAMAGPTPVSALIHAATMVTAGVYMIARMNFVFMLSPMVMGIVAIVGALTAFVAATIGFAQNDIKKVLAYSTVSQLGYMFIGVGMGAFAAGVFHLFTHAFFKACLFLGAGAVIHAMAGHQDMRTMGGLRKKLPVTHWTMLLSTIAIAGIFPFSGFFSKDEVLWKTFTTANPWLGAGGGKFVYVLALAGAVCTAFYMFRLYYLTFSGECRASKETLAKFHPPTWNMTMPLVVLAIGATVLGLLGLPEVMGPNLFHHWLAPVVDKGFHIAQTTSLLASQGMAPVSPDQQLAHNHGLEWGLMAMSLGIAVTGILLARKMYNKGTSPTISGFVKAWPRLHRWCYNKYYVDEFYGATFVRLVKVSATVLFRLFDRVFIDTIAVNGSAWVVNSVGKLVRWFQNGNLQHYVAVLVAGIALLIYWASQPPDNFDIAPEGPVVVGQRVVFTAGVRGSRQLEYRWDFDGDGVWDQPAVSKDAKDAKGESFSPTANATFVYDKPGSYKVILEVRDLSWRTKSSETAVVEVRATAPAPNAPNKVSIRLDRNNASGFKNGEEVR